MCRLVKATVLSLFIFFFSSRRRHTRWPRDWSSDVCSSDLNRARLQKKPDPLEGNEPGDTHDQRRLGPIPVRPEALRVHAAWDDVNVGRGHAEGLDDVLEICL